MLKLPRRLKWYKLPGSQFPILRKGQSVSIGSADSGTYLPLGGATMDMTPVAGDPDPSILK